MSFGSRWYIYVKAGRWTHVAAATLQLKESGRKPAFMKLLFFFCETTHSNTRSTSAQVCSRPTRPSLNTHHHLHHPDPEVLVPHGVQPHACPPQPRLELVKAAVHHELHPIFHPKIYREGSRPLQHRPVPVVATAAQDHQSHILESGRSSVSIVVVVVIFTGRELSQGCKSPDLQGVVFLGSELPDRQGAAFPAFIVDRKALSGVGVKGWKCRQRRGSEHARGKKRWFAEISFDRLRARWIEWSRKAKRWGHERKRAVPFALAPQSWIARMPAIFVNLPTNLDAQAGQSTSPPISSQQPSGALCYIIRLSHLKLRSVARREHHLRGRRAPPEGGDVALSPRGIDHDSRREETRNAVQKGESSVVHNLGP